MDNYQSYRQMAGEVADRGRYGDSMLMHVNPREVAALDQAAPGTITTNPDTGYPEAFAVSIPLLLAGLGALGGGIGGGVTAKKRDQPLWQGILGGAALGGLGGYGLGAVGAPMLGGTAGGISAVVPTTTTTIGGMGTGVLGGGSTGLATGATGTLGGTLGGAGSTGFLAPGAGGYLGGSGAGLATSATGALGGTGSTGFLAPGLSGYLGGAGAGAGGAGAGGALSGLSGASSKAASGIGSFIADNPMLTLGGTAMAADAMQGGPKFDDGGGSYKGPFAEWSYAYEPEEDEEELA